VAIPIEIHFGSLSFEAISFDVK